MKVSVKNLGPINSAEFDLSNFTAITGLNNTGKTYISYAIYGFLKTWSRNTKELELGDHIEKVLNNGLAKVDLTHFINPVLKNFQKLLERYSQNIHTIFSANEEEFKNTEIIIEILENDITLNHSFESEAQIKGKPILKAKKEVNSNYLELAITIDNSSKYPSKNILIDIISEIINEAILREVLPQPFIITSERTGINIFQNELDINKNVFFEKIIQTERGKFDLNPFEYLKEVVDRYSMPIKDGIDRIRDIEKEFKQNSYISKEYPGIVKKLERDTGIGYRNIKGQHFITYKEGKRKIALPIYLGSSSSRALFDLFVFIKHSAKKGQLLIIDEPELNLHPKNQIYIARLLATLSNIGISVMITTHSDYLVKEINNLLMLSKDFHDKEKFFKKYKYSKYEYLTDINFYIAENNTLQGIDKDDYGLVRTTFDEAIRCMDDISDELFNKIS